MPLADDQVPQIWHPCGAIDSVICGSAKERGARAWQMSAELGPSPNAMDSMRVPGDAMASTWLARRCHRSGIPVVL